MTSIALATMHMQLVRSLGEILMQTMCVACWLKYFTETLHKPANRGMHCLALCRR